MRNAKEEFIKTVTGLKVICAEIVKCDNDYEFNENCSSYQLKVGHSDEEYNEFLREIDFNYDSGYGGQELFGTIWCGAGVWFDREEYDGSEWWDMHQYPEIPEELK